MTAPKHTAGPWERLQGFAEKGHPSYAEGQYVIRIVQKREPGQTEFVKVALVDAGPVDSNARLIAAAPDLLEACRAYSEWADYVIAQPEMFLPGLGEALTGPLTDSVRAALAKATGQ